MVYPALLPLMPHTSAASSRLNWRPPADLYGLANAVGSSTLHTTSEHGVSSITTADAAHLCCQQSTELTPTGLFKWTRPVLHERWNLVSARVPSHFNRPLPWMTGIIFLKLVRSSWNVMAHGDAREGKWRGNWRMHLQLDAQFFMYVYFYSLHVSGNHVPIITRIIVSMRHLVYVSLCRWPSSMMLLRVDNRLVCRSICSCIPDGHLHRVT